MFEVLAAISPPPQHQYPLKLVYANSITLLSIAHRLDAVRRTTSPCSTHSKHLPARAMLSCELLCKVAIVVPIGRILRRVLIG